MEMQTEMIKTFIQRRLSTLAASALIATTAIFAGATNASAAEIYVDVNDFQVRSQNLGGGNFNLTLSDDADTMLSDLRIDGVRPAGWYDPFTAGGSSDLTGSLLLSGNPVQGVVTGGTIVLTDDQGSTFDFGALSGTYRDSGTRQELVLFLTAGNGMIDGSTFAGADTTAFDGMPLDVSVITFYFDRALLVGARTDEDGDLDVIAVTIPEPTSVLAVAAMGGFGLLRRRR